MCDGSLVPSALNVNPLLTISALTERAVERNIQALQGKPYPQPNKSASLSTIDPLLVSTYTEGQLEPLFRRCTSLGINTLINQGGAPKIDVASLTIPMTNSGKASSPRIIF